MKQKWMVMPLLVLVSLVWISTGSAAQGKKTTHTQKTTKQSSASTQGANKVILTPDELQWKDGPAAIPGSKMAVLEGDPAKSGYFAIRLRIPAGTKVAAHTHGDVERVTVISGKLYMAMGEKQQNPSVLPAGSYFSLPPGTVHNVWVEEESVVQIATLGPWSMKEAKGGDTQSQGEKQHKAK